MRARVTRADLAFVDVSIHFPGEGHAMATCTARLTVETDAVWQEAALIVCELRQTEGRWRFTSFSEREVLER